MKKIALIVAGGSGSRMGAAVPKQFMLLGNKPVLVHSILAFRHAYPDVEVILVLPQPHMEMARQLLEVHQPGGQITMVAGGETRFHSVKNGLSQIQEEGIVFVHDAVRCLVTSSLIERCGKAALQYGSAIPVVPVRDSIRKKTEGGSSPVPREDLLIVQTPQVFSVAPLKKAFGQEYTAAFTDEATVYEAHGGNVHLVEGERTNIKITYPEDLSFAAWLLSGERPVS